MMMRQDHSNAKDAEVPKASLAEVRTSDGRPRYRREAEEAFEQPAKIDDSFLANWAPRMPAFIEDSPYFYAAAFVGAAFAFMGFVCFYVHYEDSKDDEKRERMRNAVMRRAAASAAMGVPRMGTAFAPNPSPAALRAAAESVARSQPLAPTPKARAASAAAAAGNGMSALTNAMGNFTGLLGGEGNGNGKMFGSPDLSTASGASTPRSQLSSHHSGSSRSGRNTRICNGTVLTARMGEVIFASSSSWQEIGRLVGGQQVIAAGPPEVADEYTMVPIKPRGAVDLKTLVVQEY